ncbi:MAG: HAD hydrolase family protein, partial [Candidatus Rokubacteria bacterium]|nr:HAD hydrolase family protein [Candidatus Rokubacteria bacterium]
MAPRCSRSEPSPCVLSSRPRVVATDLDGTLLSSASRLSERTRSALRAARAAGHRVVLATARPARVVDGIVGA